MFNDGYDTAFSQWVLTGAGAAVATAAAEDDSPPLEEQHHIVFQLDPESTVILPVADAVGTDAQVQDQIETDHQKPQAKRSVRAGRPEATPCPHCGKTFYKKGALKLHVRLFTTYYRNVMRPFLHIFDLS